MNCSLRAHVGTWVHGVGTRIKVDAEVPGVVRFEANLLTATLDCEGSIRQNLSIRTEGTARDEVGPGKKVKAKYDGASE